MSEKLKRFDCQLNNKLLDILFAMLGDRIMNNLNFDLVGSIVSIFYDDPTPLLLPICTIKQLIKQNKKFLIILFILSTSI